MRKRRAFFFFFLTIVLTLVWAIIHYERPIYGGVVTAADGSSYTSPSPSFYLVVLYGIASFFFYVHGFSTFVMIFTRWGRRVVHETQGMKIIVWAVVSLVLASIFLLLPLVLHLSTALRHSERMAVFSTISCLLIIILHHLGISQFYSWLAFASTFALWIVYMQVESMPASVVLEVMVVQDFSSTNSHSSLPYPTLIFSFPSPTLTIHTHYLSRHLLSSSPSPLSLSHHLIPQVSIFMLAKTTSVQDFTIPHSTLPYHTLL